MLAPSWGDSWLRLCSDALTWHHLSQLQHAALVNAGLVWLLGKERWSWRSPKLVTDEITAISYTFWDSTMRTCKCTKYFNTQHLPTVMTFNYTCRYLSLSIQLKILLISSRYNKNHENVIIIISTYIHVKKNRMMSNLYTSAQKLYIVYTPQSSQLHPLPPGPDRQRCVMAATFPSSNNILQCIVFLYHTIQ